MKRSSGVLLSVSSLPSPYGIGTLGKAAYEFADFLQEAGQHYWQMLPLGPTSYGDSPYASFSSYAGNPYFIDLDMLIEDELLTQSEVDCCEWGTEPRYVDYGKMYTSKYQVLRQAKARGWERDAEEVAVFVKENERWIHDYALFMSCKSHFKNAAWTAWDDEDLRLRRNPKVLDFYRELLHEDVEFYTYIQYLFYKQWNALKEYLHEKDIEIIGDVPIYVALDSVDVWAEPWFFQLDEKNYPVRVSGVPPDYFSEDGQLWGNPLYDWDKMEADGFGWWIRRIDGVGKLFDVIRVDHFRGFESYWSVPADATTAKAGKWCKGPGMKLVGVLNSWFKNLSYIAEDLGEHSDAVDQLLADSTWPGMKVLSFAYSTGKPSSYLPCYYEPECICYTGTHDNAPLAEWAETAPKAELDILKNYIGSFGDDGLVWSVIRSGMGSVAKLFVAQMQDYLELGKYHRMNTPGVATGNWQWRLLKGEASPELAARMHAMAKTYGRVIETEVEKAAEEETKAEATETKTVEKTEE